MEKITNFPQKKQDIFLRLSVYLAALLTMASLVFIVGYILVRGLPYLRPSFFSLKYTSENVSAFPAIISTLVMTLLALGISAPLGIFSAVYLVEYAPKNSRMVRVIRITAETLSGIPSIVYGLFGMLFFVTYLGWGFSLIAGAFTLSIMILPLIMRTAEEALLSVPDIYREGSYGLGAGRLRTVFRITLPAAVPGILAGVILGVGRVAGETAALIYTAGTVARIPEGLFESTRTLAIHMYALSSEGHNMNEAYATAAVLLALVVVINVMSARLAKKAVKE